MKIAVVSTDGVTVNDHFGKASRFLIHEMSESGPKLVEERACEPLSTGDPDHPFDEVKFSQIMAALEGCKKVFMTRIGDMPAAKLREKGVEPILYEGPIASLPM